MGSSDSSYFVITAILSPLTLVLNTLTVLALFSLQEARRHVVVISLSILHIMFIAYNFMDQYYWNFIASDGHPHEEKFAFNLIHSFSLPLYLAAILHMFLMLINMLWTAKNAERPVSLRLRHTRIFTYMATCMWIVPSLSLLLYTTINVGKVLQYSLQYVLIAFHMSYVLLFCISIYHIFLTKRIERERLISGDTTEITEYFKAGEGKILNLYTAISVNYILLTLLPLTIYGIILYSKKDIDLGDTFKSSLEAFLQIWPVSTPLTFFVFYHRAILERLKRNTYLHIDNSFTVNDSELALETFTPRNELVAPVSQPPTLSHV